MTTRIKRETAFYRKHAREMFVEELAELTGRTEAYVTGRLSALGIEALEKPVDDLIPIEPVSDVTIQAVEPEPEPIEVQPDPEPESVVPSPAPDSSSRVVAMRLGPSGVIALASIRGEAEPERVVPLKSVREFRTLVSDYGRRGFTFDLEGDLAVFAGWLHRSLHGGGA